MNLREWLIKTMEEAKKEVPIFVRPHIVCNDGFRMSVQASVGHYCFPKAALEDGGYEEVEVGFLSDLEELLLPYAEEPDKPTATVYPYTPVKVVEKVIKKHGGMMDE